MQKKGQDSLKQGDSISGGFVHSKEEGKIETGQWQLHRRRQHSWGLEKAGQRSRKHNGHAVQDLNTSSGLKCLSPLNNCLFKSIWAAVSSICFF